MFDRSVPQDGPTTDEPSGTRSARLLFAVGIRPQGQRPELSLPKGLGLTKPSLPFPTPRT